MATGPSSDQPGMVLEVVHGRTQFKHRPVSSARFLIGSGDACDLRLNAPEIPLLHTLVVLEDGQATIETVAETPALIVNGQPVREAELRDGDRIRIGVFELRATFSVRPPAAASAMDVESPAQPLEMMSAAEIVDQIERDTALVTEADRVRRLGAQALVAEALRRANPAIAVSAVETLQGPHFNRKPAHIERGENRDELARDLDSLSRVLDDLSRQLDHQHEHAQHRESSYVAATEEILDSHDRLAERVEWLSRQVAELQSRLPSVRSRVSA